MKATFTPSYTNDSPCDYVRLLLGKLDYQLPFVAVEKLKRYLAALTNEVSPRIAMIGSGYGLEAVALRHDLPMDSVLGLWGERALAERPLGKVQFDCQLSMFDLEEGPLDFARRTGLAQKVFAADLTQPFSFEIQQELAVQTDVVTVFGAISYIGTTGFSQLVDAAFRHGESKVLAYSILKYQDHEPYLDILSSAGLVVRKVGESLKQRNYKHAEEQAKVTESLRQQGKDTPQDENELLFDLYIAYPVSSEGGASRRLETSLIVLDSELSPIASTEDCVMDSIEEMPHPWQVALAEGQARDPSVSALLSDWQTRGYLLPGDTVTFPEESLSASITRFEQTFSGEYQLSSVSTMGKSRVSLTRVIPEVNANFSVTLPADLKALERHLHERGHVIVRGGKDGSGEDQLNELMQAAGVMNYNTYGTQKRTQIKKSKLQNVTPWPKDVVILPHNEMTYHTSFPEFIAFNCIRPTNYGGETTMFDCSRATEILSEKFRTKATDQDIVVQRRYTEVSRSMGHASWKQAAGDDADAEAAVEHFSALGFKSYVREEMTPEGLEPVVFTELRRPLVYDYQGHRCLHATIAGISPYWYKSLTPDRVPPYAVFWNDGSRLSDDEFAEIERAVSASRIHYAGWHADDIMILANPMIAHGRHPLVGDRLIGYSVARPARFLASSDGWKVETIAEVPLRASA